VFKPASGNSEPSANLNDVKAGIDWVVAHGAKVVNLSLGAEGGGGVVGGLVGGGDNTASPLGAAVQSAWDHGAIPVIAAGNDNQKLFGASGSYGDLDAIVVGANIKSGAVAGYSSGLTTGTKWGIVAPGGDNNGVNDDMILSSFAGGSCNPASAPNCYGFLSGTSMAAPMVSGAAALLLSQGLSREQAVQTLLSTADKVSCGSGCQGRLNVGKAVAAHASTGGSGGAGGGGAGTTAPTRKTTRTSSPTGIAASPASTATPAAPETTTSLLAPDGDGPDTTVTTVKPREAIVLNSGRSGRSGVPAAAGVAGVGLLIAAAAGTVISARRTRAGITPF
jgi:subtilisin family serine protease